MFFHIYLFTYLFLQTDHCFFSFLSSQSVPLFPFVPSPSTPLPFLFREGQASHGYQPDIAYNKLKAEWGDFLWGYPKSQHKSQRQPLLTLLGVPQEDHATQLSHIYRELRSVPCRLPNCQFSLCEPLWVQVSWFCKIYCGVFGLLAPTILPSLLLQGYLRSA